jgi:type IV secretion system protein VirD4
MVIRKCPWQRTERQKWATPIMLARARRQLGLSGLDEDTRRLYGELLPRGVMAPRLMPDRPPLNYWMEPQMLADMTWRPGEIILGKIGGSFIGYLDDRPIVTIAGARAGKSSTVLLPNLFLYPGSMLVLDNKGELAAATAEIRRAQGHRVIVLDPFGASKLLSSSYNPLADLDPESNTIVDDAAAVAQSIVEEIAEGNGKHFTDGARALTQGIVLFTLTLPEEMGQDLVTVRELLTLTHPHLLAAVRTARLNR